MAVTFSEIFIVYMDAQIPIFNLHFKILLFFIYELFLINNIIKYINKVKYKGLFNPNNILSYNLHLFTLK